jgi:alkanesulfonate monooxygenase SsuD/methylene tetrahydromethanopterin reductase-like flavin-dependent oxidoreductase (luciferase family)
MVALSISIETFAGLSWPAWRRAVAETERLGFAGLFRSDHLAGEGPGDAETLDLVVALSYLAAHTGRVRFGSLVAPLSFRDPRILAHQAAALDALSQGRMILGLGAGWNAREHEMFGYALGDAQERMERLAEGLEVVTRLLRDGAPASFSGRFYQLREAQCFTPGHRPSGPPILIGGNGLGRTLPLVARFADIWNGIYLAPEAYAERSRALDRLLEQAGRRPQDVRRTLTIFPVCGRTPQELEGRLRWMRQRMGMQHAPLGDLLALARSWSALVGTPEELIAQFKAYAAAGVEEIMLQWYDADDCAGLRALAEEVLPHLAA